MLKIQIPVLLTLIVGIIMLMGFFTTHPGVKTLRDELEQWCLIVIAVATILGIANILRVNLKTILSRGTDWPYKLVLVGAMFLMMAAGLFDLITAGRLRLDGFFIYLYNITYTPLAATMFALLAFYIASAAFRAFRARNIRATLLLVAASVVIIGRVPLGRAVSGYFPLLADWLMAYPNAAGQRAMIIGAAMGVIATSLRFIFGIERPYLRGD